MVAVDCTYVHMFKIVAKQSLSVFLYYHCVTSFCNYYAVEFSIHAPPYAHACTHTQTRTHTHTHTNTHAHTDTHTHTHFLLYKTIVGKLRHQKESFEH